MRGLRWLGLALVVGLLTAGCDRTDDDDQGDADADDDIGADSVDGNDSASSPCDPPCNLANARCDVGENGQHIAVSCNMQTRCLEMTVCEPGVMCGMQTGVAECGLQDETGAGW